MHWPRAILAAARTWHRYPDRPEESAVVLVDWTDGYRDTFVAGMDGDPQSSVDAIVNEVIFRVTDTDDQGLRALVEATARRPLRQPQRRPGGLPPRRAEGDPGRGAALLGEAVDDGRLLALVAARSDDTAARLEAGSATVTAAAPPCPTRSPPPSRTPTRSGPPRRRWRRSRCSWPPRSPASSGSRSASATLTATLDGVAHRGSGGGGGRGHRGPGRSWRRAMRPR